MILERPDVTVEEFARVTGWEIKPEGACQGAECVLLPPNARDAAGRIDVTVVAERLGMPIARDEAHGLWALGPRSGDRRVLDSARLPDVVLQDFQGEPFDLASLRGRRVVLVSWASWCGCRFDLPGWQALHEEVSPAGIDIVTVALDTDLEAARPFHEAAHPTHPSLADPAHLTSDLFGMTNVPFALWIDEDGTIVRPAEVAFGPPEARGLSAEVAQLPDEPRRIVTEMMANVGDTNRYVAAVRDWAEHGAESHYVLSEDEVIARSRPRPPEFGLAAAHFALAQHLQRTGAPRDAVPHFQEAHRLDPTNWNHQREALSLADPAWGQVYDRDLLSEVDAVGVDTFYPTLEL